MVLKPLSLLQAFNARQDGTISWEEYIHIHLLRATGVNNDDDNTGYIYMNFELRQIDPFGHMLGCWMNRLGHIEDICPFEEFFKSYRHGSLNDVKDELTALERLSPKAFEGGKQTLAMLACQERRADALKYCLDQGGFTIESTFLDEAKRVDAAKDPETYDALAQYSDIEQIWELDKVNSERRDKRQREADQRREANQRGEHWKPPDDGGGDGTWEGYHHGAPPGTAAVFDVGGTLPVKW